MFGLILPTHDKRESRFKSSSKLGTPSKKTPQHSKKLDLRPGRVLQRLGHTIGSYAFEFVTFVDKKKSRPVCHGVKP
ncbi:hypothetical protein QVD17_20865 [Tagetes erecta]|uniref:Uncharacterized protein n=1 Tax=Tagetes erecta TaxID=13708 RepID=A0AAD8KPZ0_TARER|nr:hypothetical protein QVD17_20865 [Tagetes erecta]